MATVMPKEHGQQLMQEGAVRDKVTGDGQVLNMFPEDVTKAPVASKEKLDKEK